jgi:hypothetical protein
MHLVSRRSQRMVIGANNFYLAEGESIRTEHSYKYVRGEFRQLAAGAGLEVKRCWIDQREWFSVQYLAPFEKDLPIAQALEKKVAFGQRRGKVSYGEPSITVATKVKLQRSAYERSAKTVRQ